MVDALVSVVAENLLKMAGDEAMLLIGVRTELEDLSRELRTIRAVLQDAEMKQIKVEAVRIWLQNLKYVAYEIEDMVEAWDQVRNSSSPFSCMLHPFRHSKFGHKVKTIKEKLAKIASEKDRYHLREIIIPVREQEYRQTFSYVEQSSVIGRDRDSEMLSRKLIEEDLACKEGEVPVIAIVGVGGVGKTTVAQVVFNTNQENNTSGKFTKFIWVCISNNFIFKDAMISIIKNGGGKIPKEDEDQVELIQKKLVELIKNEKYLLVLDDVWNEDELKWEPLQIILNHGKKGSRIVVTTRNNRVARAMKSVHIQDLGVLPNDDCWSIFKKLVFEESNDSQGGYKYLEEIGKQIVEKCGGLPLAVKTIASALRKKARGKQPTPGLLENILKSDIWDVSESDVGILPALMLSYIELPSKLKNCFCYCSLFEKDFIFRKDDLTKMWVAQGYIVANDKQEVECIAEEYFDELLDRSLFQEPKLDKHGNIKSCMMHDLVHDLTQWLTKIEFSIMKMKDPRNRLMSLANARHCAVLEELRWEKDLALMGVENLRTLIYLVDNYRIFEESHIGGVIKHLQSVRVLSLQRVSMRDVCGLEMLVHLRYLSLSGSEIKVLPKSIGKLKELRYLDLSDTNIRRLPKTITSLSHLQTLNLSDCGNLLKLPGGIPGMDNLRHLDVWGCLTLKKLPDGIGGLTLLQTLGRFPVAVALGGGKGGCSNIGELGGLNRLRGFLSITNLGAVGSEEEARSAKLQDKTSLVDIQLHWGSTSGESLHPPMDVLESLCPPPKLETLEIHRYPGGAFPSWMGDSSAWPLLSTVRLLKCINWTQLPPLGQLPCLESLTISGLPGVKEVGEEFLPIGLGDDEGGTSVIAFPQLKSLEFRSMDSWERWAAPLSTSSPSPSPSSGVPVNKATNANATILPRLRELTLWGCRKLEGVPPIFTTALQKLRIIDCPMLRSLQFLPPSIQSLKLSGLSTGKLLADCPTGTLPSLQHLEIGFDSELTADQLNRALHLSTTLQSLEIDVCKNLRTLPDGLMRLTTLENLSVVGCENLRTLSEGLTRLTSLQTLEIWRCSPELHESCQVGGGLWPRIAHIPRIEIDGREVQKLNGR